MPAIDMSEDEKTYKISAELPGMDARDVDVSVTGDMLVLKGEKSARKRRKRIRTIIFPSAYGSFQRAFELPATVDRGKIAADFSKGVLTITPPKTVEAQQPTTKIAVKAS